MQPLSTRCPRCAATFAVSPEQLRARDGLVRCGACSAVFDARLYVLDDDIPTLVPAGTAAAAGLSDTAVYVDPSSDASFDTPYPPAITPLPAVLRRRDGRTEPVLGGGSFAAIPAVIPSPPPALVADPSARFDGSGAPRAQVYTVAADEGGDADLDAFNPFADDDGEADDAPHALGARLQRALVWLAVAVALVALLAQTLWVFRVQIAANWPALRPAFEALCQPLGCTVGYPRHLDRLVITESSLQSHPAAVTPQPQPPPPQTAARAPQRLTLTLTLANRHSQPQPWPALMLELRDYSDTVVVRRVLAPADYLSPDALATPFAAAATVKLTVPLAATGVAVNGYQIVPFYP